MSDKIIRPDANMPIFAKLAVASDLKIFGTATPSTDIALLLTNANAKDGWSSGVGANGAPAKEWFNAVGYTLSYITSLYLQDGITDWNTNQSYYKNSQCKSPINGFTYASKTGTAPSTPNPGNTDPSVDGTNWRLAFLDSANTVTYTPSANYHPATKKYVDDNGGLDVASTAEAQAQVDNTTAISPLRLFEALQGSNQSLATNGYQILPGGLIIQWGIDEDLPNRNFPITFPTACFSIVATHATVASLANGNSAQIISTSQFSLQLGTSGGQNLHWIAIGH